MYFIALYEINRIFAVNNVYHLFALRLRWRFLGTQFLWGTLQ